MTRAWAAGLLTLLLAMLGAVPAAAVPGTSGKISGLDVSAGRVQFLLEAAGLSGGTLDPAGVKVTVGGQALRVTAEPPGTGAGGRRPSRAVMIVLDTSASMGAADLKAAKKGVLSYVQRLPQDISAGLTTTSPAASARQTVAPTTDRGAVSGAVRNVRSGGGTALYDALSLSLAQLGRAGAQNKRIVVLSDGADSVSKTTLAAVTGQLTRERVPVDLVAYRTHAASETTLRTLAAASGGRLIHSADARRMVAAFAGAADAFTQTMWITVTVPPSLAGQASRLDVQVSAGAVTVHAGTLVTFATVAAGSRPQRESRSMPSAIAQPASPPVTLIFVLATCFMAFVAIVGAVVTISRRAERPEWAEQIDRYRAPRTAKDGQTERSTAAGAVLALTQRVLESGSFEERIAHDLDRAALPLRPHEWTLVRGITAIALSAVFAVLTGNVFAGPLIGVLLAWVATRGFLKFRIGRRMAAFGEQLPDALQLIAGSLRSGFTASQALSRLAQQDTQPLGAEMARAVAETRLGVPMEDALDKIADRMQCPDLSWVILAMRIQREVGGNLADVIDTTIDTMRERTRLRRHVKALSAEGRLTAYILISLPIVIALAMLVTRPAYVRPLYTQPMGLLMLIAGCLSITVGWLWMSRIIKVEP